MSGCAPWDCKVRDVHFPQGGGALSVIIQVEPAADGQVTDALLAVLGSPWTNTKMAIAVDPDINIYDDRDVHYAMATRVDPSRDVTIIGNARGFIVRPDRAADAGGAAPDAAATRSPSVVGQVGNRCDQARCRTARPSARITSAPGPSGGARSS